MLCYPRLFGYTFNPLSVYFETDIEGLLSATFNGHRCSHTNQELFRSFLSLPMVTLKVVAAIHWEALRLWLKGVRLVPPCGQDSR